MKKTQLFSVLMLTVWLLFSWGCATVDYSKMTPEQIAAVEKANAENRKLALEGVKLLNSKDEAAKERKHEEALARIEASKYNRTPVVTAKPPEDSQEAGQAEENTTHLALRFHHYNPDGKDEGMGCTLICCNKDEKFDSVTLGGKSMQYHRGKEEDHVGDNRDAWVIWHARGCTGNLVAKKGAKVYSKMITKSSGFTKGQCWGELHR